MNHLKNCQIVGCDVTNARYIAESAREDGSPVRRTEPDYVMSRGSLMDLAACPWKWAQGKFEDDTKSTDWGTLMDTLLLTPSKMIELYAVAPETYMSEPKKKGDEPEEKPWNNNANVCKEWNAEQERLGKTVIKTEIHDAAHHAKAILLGDHQVKSLLGACKTQMMIVGEYEDRETGLVVPLKGLIDIVPSKDSAAFGECLADFKTAKSAAHRAWESAVFQHHYDAQAALYLDLFNGATGEQRFQFLHVIQESFAPWAIGRRVLSQQFIEIGRAKYLAALRLYCQCLASKTWPDYDSAGINGWTLTEPQPWMVAVETTVKTNAPEPTPEPSDDLMP